MKTPLSLILPALVLAGCAVAPVDHFHSLRPLAESEAATASRAVQGLPPAWIAVGPVTLPSALDRAQWVVRRSATSLQVLEQQRWVQPLGLEIGEAVAAHLQRQTGLYALADNGVWPDARNQPALRITVQVLRMDSLQTASLGIDDQFRWTVSCGAFSKNNAVSRTGLFSTAPPLPPSAPAADDAPQRAYDRLAQGHAQALLGLSQDLGAAVLDLHAACTPP